MSTEERFVKSVFLTFVEASQGGAMRVLRALVDHSPLVKSGEGAVVKALPFIALLEAAIADEKENVPGSDFTWVILRDEKTAAHVRELCVKLGIAAAVIYDGEASPSRNALLFHPEKAEECPS